MSDFMNNLNKVGMILQAGGGSLAGRDGMGVVREYQAQQEDERRRAAIAGLLQQSGIGGVQRGLIEQLPVGEQAPVILNMLAQMEAQRRAGGAAGAAAARDAAAQEARMAQWQALTAGQPQAAPGGFSLGETLTDVPAPSAPLSFGLPSAMPQAMPAPPPASMPMSFGEIVPTAPQPQAAPSPYNMYRRALEQAYMAPPGTIDPEVIKGLEERVKFFAPPEQELFDPDRYRVVGNTLYDLADLDENGRPKPVAEGAGQQEVIFGADGQPIVARGPAGANFKFTEAQSKDNVFATRASGALEVLDPIANSLTDRWGRLAEMDPTGFAREMQTPEFQMAQQAGEEYLQAILRKDTGAAITADEQLLYGRTFLPRPGDGPEVLANKAKARRRALEAIKAGMSPVQILAMERALGEVPVPEVPPQQGAQPEQQSSANEQPASAKFAQMNLDQLLNNIPTTEAEATEWNKRYEALGGN